MALFDSGVPLANVALSDTFNTWRVRTNQINTQAAGLASNNTFTGTLNTFNNTASFKGPVTAPIITANTVNGTAANFTTLQADSIDFDGDLTVDNVSANSISSKSGTFTGPVTAPSITANTINGTAANFTTLQADAIDFDGDLTVDLVTANTLAGTLSTAAQPNITSVGTLSSLTVSGSMTAANADFSGPVTAPTVTANSFSGDGSGLTGLSAGLDWSTTTSTDTHYLFVASNTSGAGIDQFNVATGITIHPGSARITANTFIGDGSGLTGISAGATVTDKSDDVNYNVVFTNETSGTQSLAGIDNGSLIYNPSTGQLSATDFNSTSDVAYKEEVQPIVNATEVVSMLSGKSFNWKHTGKRSYGVIAQELEQVLPDVVHENANGKTVNYNTLIAFLIESNKELLNRIEVLESKLEK